MIKSDPMESKRREEEVMGEANGLLKMFFVINDCSDEWSQDCYFRKYSINKMTTF